MRARAGRWTYEQWVADLGPRHRSLMWIARIEGEGDVAVMLTRDDKDAMGWIGNLGVHKQARGRGLGGHLLRHAFGTYAARGRDTIGPAMDTRNESRALAPTRRTGCRRSTGSTPGSWS